MLHEQLLYASQSKTLHGSMSSNNTKPIKIVVVAARDNNADTQSSDLAAALVQGMTVNASSVTNVTLNKNGVNFFSKTLNEKISDKKSWLSNARQSFLRFENEIALNKINHLINVTESQIKINLRDKIILRDAYLLRAEIYRSNGDKLKSSADIKSAAIMQVRKKINKNIISPSLLDSYSNPNPFNEYKSQFGMTNRQVAIVDDLLVKNGASKLVIVDVDGEKNSHSGWITIHQYSRPGVHQQHNPIQIKLGKNYGRIERRLSLLAKQLVTIESDYSIDRKSKISKWVWVTLGGIILGGVITGAVISAAGSNQSSVNLEFQE